MRLKPSIGHLSWLMAASVAVMGCVGHPQEIRQNNDTPQRLSDYRVGKGDSVQNMDGQCGPFPDYYFEFLDDTKCKKRLPSNRDRHFVCPVVSTTPAPQPSDIERQFTYQPASSEPNVDSTALAAYGPDDLNIIVILVKRIDGIPHYRYLSNGTHNVIVQPWSSTKFMAIANAGAALRKASDGLVGLSAVVDSIPVGDLVTLVHNYQGTPYSSNGLARWFLDIGTRRQLGAFVHDEWLNRPNAETLGGNYGQPSADLGTYFVDELGHTDMPKDDSPGPDNQLSTYTIAEFLKRLVMHRENPEFAMPYLQWSDVEVLLYGASNSMLFQNGQPQGMESDPTIYLQQALDINAIDSETAGRWRIFSKLGFGYARGGEFVNAGYGCFPVFDDKNRAIPDRGIEFFIVTQLNAQRAHRETDRLIAETYRQIIGDIRSGNIR